MMEPTKMPEQLVFDLSQRPAFGREDFLVSPSNQEAVAQVDQWPDWPAKTLCLVGPPGSGKTHLAHVWRAVSGAELVSGDELDEGKLKALLQASAVIVEDADRGVDEEKLFHLYNSLARRGGALFLTGCTPPSQWNLQLPDLKSRLSTIAIAELEPPDDALIAGLLVKQFQDRQVQVDPKVIGYLINRLERSFESITQAVEALDQASLKGKTRITVPLARKILETN
jgi:DnaA regulatory inactivator Hda